MGTLFEKLKYTKDSVNDIQAAIIEKGVSVIDTVPLEDYGDKIREIQTGELNVNVFNIQQEGNTITYLHKNGLTGIISHNSGIKHVCIIKGSEIIYDNEFTDIMHMYFISKGILVIGNGRIELFTHTDIIHDFYNVYHVDAKLEATYVIGDTLYLLKSFSDRPDIHLAAYDLLNYMGGYIQPLIYRTFDQYGLIGYKHIVVENILYIIFNSIATPETSVIYKFNRLEYHPPGIINSLTNPVIFNYNDSEYIISDMDIYRYNGINGTYTELKSNLTNLREIYICNDYIILNSLDGLHIYNSNSHKNLIINGYSDLTPLLKYRVWNTSYNSNISDIIKDDTVPMFAVKHEVTPDVFKIKLAYIKLHLDDIVLEYLSDSTEIIHNIRSYVNIKNKSLTFIDNNASYVWFNGIYGVEYNLVLSNRAVSLTRTTIGNYHILKLTNDDSSIKIVIINILTGKNNIIWNIPANNEYQFFDYSEFDHVIVQISNQICVINNTTNFMNTIDTGSILHSLKFVSNYGLFFSKDNKSHLLEYSFSQHSSFDRGMHPQLAFSLDSILEKIYINSELIGYIVLTDDNSIYYININMSVDTGAQLKYKMLKLGEYIEGSYKCIVSEKHLTVICNKQNTLHTYILPYRDYSNWYNLDNNGVINTAIKSLTDDTSATFMSINVDDKKQEVVYIPSIINYTKPINLTLSGLYVFPKNNKVLMLNNLIVTDYTKDCRLSTDLRWNESDVIEIKKTNDTEPKVKLESIGKGVFIKNLILSTGYIYNMNFTIKRAIPNNIWSVIDNGTILTDKSFTIIINDIEPRTENKILEY